MENTNSESYREKLAKAQYEELLKERKHKEEKAKANYELIMRHRKARRTITWAFVIFLVLAIAFGISYIS